MMAMPNEEFAQQVLRLAQPAEPFKPTAAYDPDGDCIEFLAKPDPFYGERVDDLVTVYYSQDTHEVIGSLIKGVTPFCKNMLQKFPGFKIEVQDGRVRLEHMFLARLWTAAELKPDDLPTVASYEKLIAVAKESDVEAEVCVA